MPAPEFDHDRGLVWFRRDLRIDDHAALSEALLRCRRVHCCFVFDREILDPLLARGLAADRRVEFIHASVVELDSLLRDASSGRAGGLIVVHDRARDAMPRLASELAVDAVFVARDHEPSAIDRDRAVAEALARDGRAFVAVKDQTIFENDEIVTKTGTPYTVFTPYKRAWLAALSPRDVAPHPVAGHAERLAPLGAERTIPSLESLGFERTNLATIGIPPGVSGAHQLAEAFGERIGDYADGRDPPAARGTSYLSVHLRFGTISIRALARMAIDRAQHAAEARGADAWLGELIWRDFYAQILQHRPDLAAGASFKPTFDRVAWVGGAPGDERFAAWCEARTGYPLVDAAMAQLAGSGFMHNRLRMVTASFLSKHLGVDWRRGEAYFADRLNDFELANNNGGWQWAASSGCDAQPWFRIFNPVAQSERFDPDGAFIRRYLPVLAKLPKNAIHAPWTADAETLRNAGVVLGIDYPEPIVDHRTARDEALARYAVVRATTGAVPR